MTKGLALNLRTGMHLSPFSLTHFPQIQFLLVRLQGTLGPACPNSQYQM